MTSPTCPSEVGLVACRRKFYSGGCSSPLFNHPVTLSVFSGSGPSHSKHWNVRLPLPPGGNARIRSAPQPGHFGRLVWRIVITILDRQLTSACLGVERYMLDSPNGQSKNTMLMNGKLR